MSFFHAKNVGSNVVQLLPHRELSMILGRGSMLHQADQRYSDLAITTVLVIKRVFRLTLRAAQGLLIPFLH
jgi:hypothetical protein